ncbi:MAG: V-type ATPase subunit [Synergistaceae bacterium]|nr:V-type ATPase subunit [Synergistaceae bacterium]
MSSQEAYGYAVARIRAMEHRLLDSGVLQRMIDAEDFSSILKILGETSYSSELSSQTTESDFDKTLEADLHNIYEEIYAFVPDKSLVDIMRLQYDFHNVKVLLKSMFNVRAGGKKRWDLLTSLGSYPLDDMITNVESEEYRLLPFGLSTLLPKCITIWEQSKDVLEVERLIDKRMFEVMLEKAKELDMPGIISWVKARTDGENIRTLLRLKRFNFDASKALPFLHEGGDIDINMLVSLITEPFETWGRALEFSDFGKMIGSIDVSCGFSDLILSLEKALEDFYLEKIGAGRYSSSDPANIPAYLWAKEMEIKNIRVIMVSKRNKGDKDKLRGLMRHGYV